MPIFNVVNLKNQHKMKLKIYKLKTMRKIFIHTSASLDE